MLPNLQITTDVVKFTEDVPMKTSLTVQFLESIFVQNIVFGPYEETRSVYKRLLYIY